jgi:hypothetical protein
VENLVSVPATKATMAKLVEVTTVMEARETPVMVVPLVPSFAEAAPATSASLFVRRLLGAVDEGPSVLPSLPADLAAFVQAQPSTVALLELTCRQQSP